MTRDIIGFFGGRTVPLRALAESTELRAQLERIRLLAEAIRKRGEKA
jgi:hypothetical protein